MPDLRPSLALVCRSIDLAEEITDHIVGSFSQDLDLTFLQVFDNDGHALSCRAELDDLE